MAGGLSEFPRHPSIHYSPLRIRLLAEWEPEKSGFGINVFLKDLQLVGEPQFVIFQHLYLTLQTPEVFLGLSKSSRQVLAVLLNL